MGKTLLSLLCCIPYYMTNDCTSFIKPEKKSTAFFSKAFVTSAHFNVKWTEHFFYITMYTVS